MIRGICASRWGCREPTITTSASRRSSRTIARSRCCISTDNRWRVIWTDGRQLPTLVDGGVELGGELREQRLFGYSVGRWVDDYTFEARTIGTMPEDRAWLDSTGRPISDQVRVTETFKRISLDEMEWSETIDDPKVYSKPWETMRFTMRLHDPRTDIMEYYCSPIDQANYNKVFGSTVSK